MALLSAFALFSRYVFDIVNVLLCFLSLSCILLFYKLFTSFFWLLWFHSKLMLAYPDTLFLELSTSLTTTIDCLKYWWCHYLLVQAFRSAKISVYKYVCVFPAPVLQRFFQTKEEGRAVWQQAFTSISSLFIDLLVFLVSVLLFLMLKNVHSLFKMQTQDHFWSRAHSEVVSLFVLCLRKKNISETVTIIQQKKKFHSVYMWRISLYLLSGCVLLCTLALL